MGCCDMVVDLSYEKDLRDYGRSFVLNKAIVLDSYDSNLRLFGARRGGLRLRRNTVFATA